MSMTLPKETLTKFPARVLVETGTNVGDCISLALECGFTKVISIEKSGHYYEIASKRFLGDSRVTVIHGDSIDVLHEVISEFNEPITFWLDSHYTPGLPLSAAGPCPILREISLIGQHRIKGHAILVDDVSCFSTPVLDNITIHQVQEEILKISDQYKFSFERGKFERDVLAAVV
jgi:hypothetical protein